ncbi:MAG TPA: hypothetical protein VNH38_08690 [Candidatus Dormibacteraeota bacterium]|nr:hypothetical protein [Candidatus Dormibacteraeota bacterium]
MSIDGAFGPETAHIHLAGLHPGKRYTIVQFQAPVSATVKIVETGPITQSDFETRTGGDFLGPVQGIEAEGNGTLSVSESGQSGSLRVTLPQGDVISGHWHCGSRRTTGPVNRPVLPPATVPPVVDECAIGAISDTPPPPASCPNGDLNVIAWTRVSDVAATGRSASLPQVEAALCRDRKLFLSFGGDPADETAELEYEYSEAALYYGWKFKLTLAKVVASANCST